MSCMVLGSYLTQICKRLAHSKTVWLLHHLSLGLFLYCVAQSYSFENDFLNSTTSKMIGELKDCKEDGFYIVYATVVAVTNDEDWWYIACKCNKDVNPHSGMYYCKSCSCHVMNNMTGVVGGDWITAEFLNEIKCSGIPNHKLVLKKGVPIMLLRNVDQSSGLCNGTRLIVEEFGNNVIGAIVVTETKIGEKVYIPRMNLVPSDPGTPLKFQRRQFPVTLCFAMTINKSQGQSLSFVGLFLPKPVFTHRQLYVAIYRVKLRSGLKILILDDNGEPCNITKNVVYPEVFQKI